MARAVALHGMGRWGELGVHLEEALSSRGRLGAQVELMLRLVGVELSADLGQLAHAKAAFEELVAHPAIDDPEVRYDAAGVRLQIATLAGDVRRGRCPRNSPRGPSPWPKRRLTPWRPRGCA